eukprot:CAMPEP_0117648048 /NCGR_PEP_ID=MMETSP0804-20121206/180_1 /TAXON_ID=1074897 /ORGANISM="Tetraselmis astigmatica, Strain CCMP880" /LENGTH=434 /DNA_ID=CAMNT_0005453591 /DNA_START=124 /DNA_END=1428 /DNA_ORIENTATION=+
MTLDDAYIPTSDAHGFGLATPKMGSAGLALPPSVERDIFASEVNGGRKSENSGSVKDRMRVWNSLVESGLATAAATDAKNGQRVESLKSQVKGTYSPTNVSTLQYKTVPKHRSSPTPTKTKLEFPTTSFQMESDKPENAEELEQQDYQSADLPEPKTPHNSSVCDSADSFDPVQDAASTTVKVVKQGFEAFNCSAALRWESAQQTWDGVLCSASPAKLCRSLSKRLGVLSGRFNGSTTSDEPPPASHSIEAVEKYDPLLDTAQTTLLAVKDGLVAFNSATAAGWSSAQDVTADLMAHEWSRAEVASILQQYLAAATLSGRRVIYSVVKPVSTMSDTERGEELDGQEMFDPLAEAASIALVRMKGGMAELNSVAVAGFGSAQEAWDSWVSRSLSPELAAMLKGQLGSVAVGGAGSVLLLAWVLALRKRGRLPVVA